MLWKEADDRTTGQDRRISRQQPKPDKKVSILLIQGLSQLHSQSAKEALL